MRLRVLYFAALRERAGCREESVDIDPGEDETLRDLWEQLVARHPELEGMQAQLRVAVEREIVDWNHRLAELEPEAEIAFIPPVSGGAVDDSATPPSEQTASRLDGAVAITPSELDRPRIEKHVRRPSAGGLFTFEGIVRNHTDGRPVDHLFYEAYAPMAADTLADIHDKATERWPEIKLAMHHRTGRLEVGETAVIVTAASAHRTASFEAVQWAIRNLKQTAPIWKKEVGPDGSQWIGQ